MKSLIPTLLLVMLLADGVRASVRNRNIASKEPPADLVRIFFADLCSAGCTEEEKKLYREKFRWQIVYLNKDSTPEYMLYIEHPDWCGAGGNCDRWLYQKTKSGYRCLAEGSRLRLLPKYTNGYRDVVSEHRVEASPRKIGYWNYAFKLYQFNGKKYRLREDKIIQKKG